jgi:hypothetical protein
MKYLFFAIFTLFFFNNDKKVPTQNRPATQSNSNLNDNITSNKMKIKIGPDTFTATLYDNETTEALKSMLPFTLMMSELNGNEKYYQFPRDLPTSYEEIGTIREGDLMLWGANTLVLFYKNLNTPYRYTKIGHIDKPRGLASAVGSGKVSISFELE